MKSLCFNILVCSILLINRIRPNAKQFSKIRFVKFFLLHQLLCTSLMPWISIKHIFHYSTPSLIRTARVRISEVPNSEGSDLPNYSPRTKGTGSEKEDKQYKANELG